MCLIYSFPCPLNFHFSYDSFLKKSHLILFQIYMLTFKCLLFLYYISNSYICTFIKTICLTFYVHVHIGNHYQSDYLICCFSWLSLMVPCFPYVWWYLSVSSFLSEFHLWEFWVKRMMVFQKGYAFVSASSWDTTHQEYLPSQLGLGL